MDYLDSPMPTGATALPAAQCLATCAYTTGHQFFTLALEAAGDHSAVDG
jgi:hypothetical protein